MNKLNQTIMLPDGRQLGYDEYGPSDGKPIFYFHGTPSSRKDWRTLGNESMPEKLGVRVIVADRPGMGLSSFQAGRSISDWSSDVENLADVLDIERFAVFGHSGAGPYVLAFALNIPQRLTAHHRSPRCYATAILQTTFGANHTPLVCLRKTLLNMKEDIV